MGLISALELMMDIILQQDGGTMLSVVWLAVLAFSIVSIAGMWKTFKKANQPGWAAIVPVYNLYIMLKIGNNSGWWVLAILFVPILNIYAYYKMSAGVSRAFGQGIGFTLGLWFLAFIFFPILGFGDYRYQGQPA